LGKGEGRYEGVVVTSDIIIFTRGEKWITIDVIRFTGGDK
jgi:hypothetical protein